MSDGSPSTPAEIATARVLMAQARQELGVLIGAGVGGLTSCFASALVGEAQLGGAAAAAGDEVTIEVVEQDGSILVIASRSKRPFFGVALKDDEALRVATQISEILNRRKG